MTYDITFVRRRPGRSLIQTLEDRSEEYDPDAEPEPMNLTAEQQDCWKRIVERVTSEIGSTTTQTYLYNVTMRREGPSGHLQLDYDGDSADIGIPYHFRGNTARAIITEAYQIAQIVEEETGLEGFDGQADQSTALGDVLTATAKFTEVARWAQANLT